MLEQIVTYSFHLFRSLGSWGVFLSMFVENLGIPMPIEIGYLLGQELISTGRHSWHFILIILTLGHTLGAIVSYFVGKLGNNYVTKKIKESSSVATIHAKLESWYKKYGNVTVFATRFIGYVRPWSSFVAGFANIPFLPFLIWTFLGSLIFNIIALYFAGILVIIWRRYEVLHFAISFTGLILFFGFLVYSAYKYYKNKSDKK